MFFLLRVPGKGSIENVMITHTTTRKKKFKTYQLNYLITKTQLTKANKRKLRRKKTRFHFLDLFIFGLKHC